MFTIISKKSKFRREVLGARRAGAEIVRVVQRGYENRATTQFTLNFDFLR